MQRFLEFPPAAWANVAMVCTILALILTFGCVRAIFVPYIALLISGFVSLTCLITYIYQVQGRIKHGKPFSFNPTLQRALWPLSLFGIPFSMGYAPWDMHPYPSDERAITGIQVHIFFLCKVTMWAWADPSSSFYYTELEGPMHWDVYPVAATVAHLCLSFFCLAIVILLESTCVFMLAFPPYVSTSEETIILDVLRDLPDGLPESTIARTRSWKGDHPGHGEEHAAHEPKAAGSTSRKVVPLKVH